MMTTHHDGGQEVGWQTMQWAWTTWTTLRLGNLKCMFLSLFFLYTDLYTRIRLWGDNYNTDVGHWQGLGLGCPQSTTSDHLKVLNSSTRNSLNYDDAHYTKDKLLACRRKESRSKVRDADSDASRTTRYVVIFFFFVFLLLNIYLQQLLVDYMYRTENHDYDSKRPIPKPDRHV